MDDPSNPWGARAKARLNRLMDKISQFEKQGGISGAVQRGVERLRQEQERMMRDTGGGTYGPLTHLARIRQAYARLEVPFGSDLDTVRRSYRALMRRYHPDRHASDPEREKVATEIAQKLTDSYDLLVSHLER
jgi:DnaJ-domain-containing protein 1